MTQKEFESIIDNVIFGKSIYEIEYRNIFMFLGKWHVKDGFSSEEEALQWVQKNIPYFYQWKLNRIDTYSIIN